jgi:hypothetical protein
MGKPAHLRNRLRHRWRLKATFPFIVRNIHLDEDIDRHIPLGRAPLKLRSKSDRVDRFHDITEGDCITGFVTLETTDEMN